MEDLEIIYLDLKDIMLLLREIKMYGLHVTKSRRNNIRIIKI